MFVAASINLVKILAVPGWSRRVAESVVQFLQVFFVSSEMLIPRQSVLRLESLPIAMETFSALGGAPASECMRMAAEADAVICIVAHRYGYVPPVELGATGSAPSPGLR